MNIIDRIYSKIYWWYCKRKSFAHWLQVKEPKLKCLCGKRARWYGYKRKTDKGHTLYLYKCPSCANVYSVELIGRGLLSLRGDKRGQATFFLSPVGRRIT